MTIDEAIIHCEEVATRKLKNENNAKCVQCGEEHVQLAKWLKELKDYKSRESQERRGENACSFIDTSG